MLNIEEFIPIQCYGPQISPSEGGNEVHFLAGISIGPFTWESDLSDFGLYINTSLEKGTVENLAIAARTAITMRAMLCKTCGYEIRKACEGISLNPYMSGINKDGDYQLVYQTNPRSL